jgi:hypothetical protein
MYRIILWISVMLFLISACTPGSQSPATPASTAVQPIVTDSAQQAGETAAIEDLPTQTMTASPTTPQATETSAPSPTPAVTMTPIQTEGPTSLPSDLAGNIVIDHNSVVLFDQIPDEYRQAAADLPMAYIDASVGHNISLGLDCLSTPSTNARNYCLRWEHRDPAYSIDPSEFVWPGTHDRSNWDFLTWVGQCDSWDRKVGCFMEIISPLLDQYEVVSYQFSYLDVVDGTSIADPAAGFFANHEDRLDVYDLEDFESQNPEKVVIYWTTSLARGIGSETSMNFNQMMRQYASENNKVLFDVADILSHTPDGRPCYDNRDGVAYLAENHPDDGQDYPAICQEYTTELEGGHLGSVSGGMIRVAKAFWVLMAQVAGWDGMSP